MFRDKYNRYISLISLLLILALTVSDSAIFHTINAYAEEIAIDENAFVEALPQFEGAMADNAETAKSEEEKIEQPDNEEFIEEIVEEVIEEVAGSENIEVEILDEEDAEEEIKEIVGEDEAIAAREDGDDAFDMSAINSVYIHTGNGFSKDAPAIGKAKLTLAGKGGNAMYYDCTGTSSGEAYTLRVPRFLMIHSEMPSLSANDSPLQLKNAIDMVASGGTVPEGYFTDYDGSVNASAYGEFYDNLRLYDYTNGQKVDEDGYRIQEEDGVWKRIKDAEGKEIYIGHRFVVDELDPNVFMTSEAEQVQHIKIPKTIKTDITYRFFSKCTMARSIDVYFEATETNMATAAEKYVSSSRTDGRNTGRDDNWDTGVLLKKNPYPGTNINYEIIYCPPKYVHVAYSFPYNDSANGTRYYIGEHAFENCELLKKIGWMGYRDPKSAVIEIGDYAFHNCTDLIEPSIFDPMIRRIGNHAFDGCTSLKNITLRQGNDTEIGAQAFRDTIIENITIPGHYRYINGESFYGMNSLKRIEMSEAADEVENIYFKAEDGILYRKQTLSSDNAIVCFPSKKVISHDAEELKKIKELPYANTYAGKENKAFMIPYDITNVDEYCFSNCANLENLIFLSTIYDIPEKAICECKSLSRVFTHSGFPDMTYINSSNFFTDCSVSNKNIQIFAPKYFDRGEKRGLYNYALDNNHTTFKLFDIDAFEFNGDGTELVKYTANKGEEAYVSDVFIPDFTINSDYSKNYVTKVLDGAFIDAKDITSITILNHLMELESGAFIEIDRLGSDRYPEKLANIFVEDGNEYFMSDCKALYKVNPATGEILELIFYPPSNEGKEFIAAPGLQSLPRYAFRGAKFLEKIKIYDNIVYIGKYTESGNILCDERSVFEGCDSLYEIDILESDPPTAEAQIHYKSHDGVLYRWDDFEHALIYYPKGERDWYKNGHNGGTYSVLEGCKTISDVNDIKELTTIYIPKSVTEIKNNAFSGTTSLRNVYFSQTGSGEGIKIIGNHAFEGCDLVNITLPYTVETIGDSAFVNTPLKYLTVYTDNLQSIGDNAFKDLRYLEIVDFIKYNENSTGQPLIIGSHAFDRNRNLKRVKISGVESVELGDGAFRGAKELEVFYLDNVPVKSLGTGCFENCVKIENIDLSYYAYDAFTRVPMYAFYECNNLFSVKLPETVTLVEENAFRNCKVLEAVNFEELRNLVAINKHAFDGCNFKRVNFAKTEALRSLYDGVFDNNNNLTAIYIPASVVNFDRTKAFASLTPDTIVYTTPNSPVARNIINTLNSELGYDAATLEDPYTEIEYDSNWKGPKVSYREIPNYIVIVTIDDETPFFKQSIGATRQLTAQVVAVDSIEPADQEVKWYSLNPEVLSVDQDGLVTLESDEYVGKFYIEAISVVSGVSQRIAIEVKDAAIYINGEQTENAYVTVNCKGKNITAFINATVNPTRTLYYEVVDGKKNIKVNENGVITGKKRGNARIKVYAKEGDGSEYPTYMECFVNVYVVVPRIEIKKKAIVLYGDRSDVIPIDHTKLETEIAGIKPIIKPMAADLPIEDQTSSEKIVTDYTKAKVAIKCESVGKKGVTDYWVENTVTWTLPDANVAYMKDEKGNEVTELTTVVGDDKNLPNEASVEVYSAVNANKSVKLIATYNGVSKKINVKVKKITTSIRPLSLDIFSTKNAYKLKPKIVGPDKKNLIWSFYNEDGTVSDYILGIDKKGYISVNPTAFDTDKTKKTVYVYLTANGVTSEPAEINIRETKTTIHVENEEKNTITIGDKKYLFMNSKGDNVVNVFCDIEGPDLKKVTWSVDDKSVVKVKGKKGIATLTGVDSGKTILSAKANEVVDTYPVLVVDTYTEFTSPEGIVLDCNRKYKEDDYGNKLSVRINGTDSTAKITWKSSDENICKIKAIDADISGEKKRTYDITQGGDYGYKRVGKIELEPVAAGKCEITAEANGIIATYKLEVIGKKEQEQDKDKKEENNK